MREKDCGTLQSIAVNKDECLLTKQSFSEALYGRVVAQDVVLDDGTILCTAGTMITKVLVKDIETSSIETIHVRSALTCMTISGVCQKCFGMDLSTR